MRTPRRSAQLCLWAWAVLELMTLNEAMLMGNRYFGCLCSAEMVSFFRVIVFAHVFAAWLKFFKIPQALACCGSTAFGNGLAEYCANFSLVS